MIVAVDTLILDIVKDNNEDRRMREVFYLTMTRLYEVQEKPYKIMPF